MTGFPEISTAHWTEDQWREISQIVSAGRALADRVEVLEADSHPPIDLRPSIVEILSELGYPSVAKTPRQAEIPGRYQSMEPALVDDRPAWQRAKVGDRVSVRIDWFPPDVGVVVEVGDGLGHRLRVNRGGGDAFWTRNERILSILPPEPAVTSVCGDARSDGSHTRSHAEPERPKDETAAKIDKAINDAALYGQGWVGLDLDKVLVEAQPAPSPESLGALKAEAMADSSALWKALSKWHRGDGDVARVDEEVAALLDRAHALGLSERVQTKPQRLPARGLWKSITAFEASAVVDANPAGKWSENRYVCDGETLLLADHPNFPPRYLLASAQQMQRVTITREQATSLFWAFMDSDTATITTREVAELICQAIPNLVIEGE